MQGQNRAGPTERIAEKDHAPDRTRRITQLAEIERDPALKEDDGHGQGDHRTQIVTENSARVHQGRAGCKGPDWSQDQPSPHHQHDGRPAQAPGQPLGGNT